LSAVRDCLLDVFAATLHIGRRSSIRLAVVTDPARSTACILHMIELSAALLQAENVCPSVRREPLGYQWTDFREIGYLNVFRKFVGKI